MRPRQMAASTKASWEGQGTGPWDSDVRRVREREGWHPCTLTWARHDMDTQKGSFLLALH